MRTLVEAAKLSNDVLLAGVIETLIERSPMLAKMPFEDIVGNSLLYNRESTLPTVQWNAVGGTWVESTGTTTQHSTGLKILGGDVDTDNFIAKTLSNVNDQKADDIQAKAKAMARTFDDCLIYGDDSVDLASVDGFHNLVDTTGQFHNSNNGDGSGDVLSLARLDEVIDFVAQLDDVTGLMMNRTVARGLRQYYRAAGLYNLSRGEDGKPMESYGEHPILINDFLVQTEAITAGNAYSAKTGGLTSSIFVFSLGPKKLHGIQNGGITKEDIGKLETKDATRTRFKWYVAWCLQNTYALARLDGIIAGSAVA